MRERVQQLVKYLLYDDDLVDIAEAVFADAMERLGLDGVFLMQITEDRESIRVIACAPGEGAGSYRHGQTISLDELPRLENGTVSCREDGCYIYMPVFLRHRAVMYVCAYKGSGAPDGEQIQGLSEITLVLQSIMSRKNFEDSLENSYRLLEEILNRIPTGVAVLDGAEKKILLMNRLAAESASVQRAVGIALKIYSESGESCIDEVYEPEEGLWFDIKFSQLEWLGGENVILCTAIDVSQKVKNQQRVEYQANNDYLTGLFNRMKCERDLVKIMDRAAEGSVSGALMYLDLDDFKQVNDSLGHQYGDVLLQEISAGISGLPQTASSCYRMGGDEFVIIIKPEYFDCLEETAEKICGMFSSPWDLMGVKHYCTMSMGIAVFPDDGGHAQEILKKADFAMYEAKRGGKNRYLRYGGGQEGIEASREEFERRLGDAVNDGCKGMDAVLASFEDAEGRAAGAEARPVLEGCGCTEKEAMTVEETAEYLGLTLKLGDYMFRRACGFARDNRGLKVYVRVYPSQLLEPGAAEYFLDTAKEAGAEPSLIALKISAEAKFRDGEKAAETVDALRARGFEIAIDRFGEGVMPLSRILAYRPETVFMSGRDIQSGRESTSGGPQDMRRASEAMAALSGKLGFALCLTGADTRKEAQRYFDCGAALAGGDFAGTYPGGNSESGEK